MADSKSNEGPKVTPEATTQAAETVTKVADAATYKKPTSGNSALRILGIPSIPSKLPSRNWMIFFALTTMFASAIIYDKREKKRNTAKWQKVISELGQEPMPSGDALPRRLTIFLAAPPGDGLRTAQDYYLEYVKPVLSGSGLDWEFVQGRQQGDIRAAVAEKIRRKRREAEGIPQEALTNAQRIDAFRKEKGIPEYEGIKGDIVIGRHAWKEYIRGVHEGWLGPLNYPEHLKTPENPKESEEKKEDKRPPQPPSYNTTIDYDQAVLPQYIPNEFDPSQPVVFPHMLGFSGTFTRLWRFMHRRELADQIGQQVAAVCFAAYRCWDLNPQKDGKNEIQKALDWEEKNWQKWVWEDDKPPAKDEEPKSKKERVWRYDVVVDQRIGERMRKFELLPKVQEKTTKVVIPEELIEGWIKGSLRSLWRWGVNTFAPPPKRHVVGDVDDE